MSLVFLVIKDGAPNLPISFAEKVSIFVKSEPRRSRPNFIEIFEAKYAIQIETAITTNEDANIIKPICQI